MQIKGVQIYNIGHSSVNTVVMKPRTTYLFSCGCMAMLLYPTWKHKHKTHLSHTQTHSITSLHAYTCIPLPHANICAYVHPTASSKTYCYNLIAQYKTLCAIQL
jgi:hypothetical protein